MLSLLPREGQTEQPHLNPPGASESRRRYRLHANTSTRDILLADMPESNRTRAGFLGIHLGSLSELAVCSTPTILVPFPQAADRHQDANAIAAAELGAAVIVWQHAPGEAALARAVWRLLGPRLRGAATAADPLLELRAGMERLAVRDAEQRLAQLIEALA